MKPLEVILSIIIVILAYYFNLLYWGIGLVGLYFLSKYITIYRVTRVVRIIIVSYLKEYNFRKGTKSKLSIPEINEILLGIMENLILSDTKFLIKVSDSDFKDMKEIIDYTSRGIKEEGIEWYFTVALKDLLPYYFSIKDRHDIDGLQKDFRSEFMTSIIKKTVSKNYPKNF